MNLDTLNEKNYNQKGELQDCVTRNDTRLILPTSRPADLHLGVSFIRLVGGTSKEHRLIAV